MEQVPGCFREEEPLSPDPIVPLLKDSGLFHCPKCDQGFKQRSNAQTHFKAVHLNLKTQCPQCGKHFKKLKSHIQDVHMEKKIVKCKICGKGYPEGRLYKDHLNKTHFQDDNGNPHAKYLITTECEVCGEFVLKSRLERHMRMKHYLPPHYVVECPICGAHVKHLPWHLQKFHKDMDYSKTMNKCEQCDKWFLKKEDLENHLLDHEKYFCFDCLVEFSSHLKLAKHMFKEHKKVFNIGKTSKVMKAKMNSSVTYHVDKVPAPEHEKSRFERINKKYIGAKANISQGSRLEGQRTNDNELFDTLEEESFTVVLDEKGNLQNVIFDDREEQGVVKVTNKEVISDIYYDVQIQVSDETGNFLDPNNQNNDTYNSSSDERLLPIFKENMSKLSNSIMVDRTSPFNLILPSETQKDLLSETACVFIEDDHNTCFEPEEGVKETRNKLYERFISAKKNLPKRLTGVDLSPEDEAVLNNAPPVEELTSEDLPKYQIGKNDQNTSNKFDACPSRQAHLCPYCRKVLKTRHSLSMHISVVHLAEKKFSCEFCDKTFATKADLVRHCKTSHDSSGKELVECNICFKSFKSSYLKRHKYYKHTSSNLSKHCDECGKEFKSREIMLKHAKKMHQNIT